MRCINCGLKVVGAPDITYKFRLVHDVPTCPYRFDFAHNDLRVIRQWVRTFWREKRWSV